MPLMNFVHIPFQKISEYAPGYEHISTACCENRVSDILKKNELLWYLQCLNKAECLVKIFWSKLRCSGGSTMSKLSS